MMLAKSQLEVPSLADKKPRHGWEIDRHVPVALIFTMLVQAGGIVWWAAGINGRMAQVEKHIERTSGQADRLTRVETKVDGIADTLIEIKDAVKSKVTHVVAKKPLTR